MVRCGLPIVSVITCRDGKGDWSVMLCFEHCVAHELFAHLPTRKCAEETARSIRRQFTTKTPDAVIGKVLRLITHGEV